MKASNLLILRKNAGYKSSAMLANELQIPRGTYARYENDPMHMPIGRAILIADTIGCTLDEIYGRTVVEEREGGELSPSSQRMLGEFTAYLRFRDSVIENEMEA